jgi:hypothetical protein
VLPDATRVERVFAGLQAHDSDIQVGDYLVGIDRHNTTDLPTKASLKIMQDLAWPRVLVFEMRGSKQMQVFTNTIVS